jgi:uncharacterized protein involved in exopolysaccharide biosynthesis
VHPETTVLPSSQPPPSPAAGPHDSASAELFEYQAIGNYAAYVAGSIGRHKLVASAVFVAVTAGAVLASLALPKTYHVEAKLLAQRNELIESLSNPGRNVLDSDPTHAAAETVLGHDNLLSIINQTDLVRQWSERRAPALRMKDFVMQLLGREPSAEDKIDVFIDLLQARYFINTSEGIVTIGVDWNDPMMALRLVEAAQQSFLEARHVRDISSITDAISILDAHAADVQRDIDRALDELEDRQRSRGSKDVEKPPPPTRRQIRAEAPNPEVTRLRDALDAKRRSIQDLEDFRRRRLEELQARKAELRAIYAEAHPAMVTIQQSIEALGRDSSQLNQLRAEETDLAGRLRARGVSAPALTTITTPTVSVQLHDSKDDPAGDYAVAQLRSLQVTHDRLIDRITSARIELDANRAAFKYRYSVLRPAQLPKEGKPATRSVVGGGVFLAVLLALFAAVLADLRAGKALQRWQVERVLQVPVLAELDLP